MEENVTFGEGGYVPVERVEDSKIEMGGLAEGYLKSEQHAV